MMGWPDRGMVQTRPPARRSDGTDLGAGKQRELTDRVIPSLHRRNLALYIRFNLKHYPLTRSSQWNVSSLSSEHQLPFRACSILVEGLSNAGQPLLHKLWEVHTKAARHGSKYELGALLGWPHKRLLQFLLH